MRKMLTIVAVLSLLLGVTEALAAKGPSISETTVQHWLRTLELPGFKRTSVYNEFHPDDGNLVATFTGPGDKLLFVSVVDLTRKSQFGFKRHAKEMIEHSAKRLVKQQQLKGRTWWSDDTTYPIAATDVTKHVKLAIMGYQGITLSELLATIKALPINILAIHAK